MDIVLTAVLTALVIGVLAAAGGFYLRNRLASNSIKASEVAAAQQIRRAEARSKEILLEAKEQAFQTRTDVEDELRRERQELQRTESRLEAREENLETRAGSLEQRDAEVRHARDAVEDERQELATMRLQEQEKLEQISGLSMADARQVLLDRAEEEVQFELARRYRDSELQAKEEADGKAREILASTIQRLASEVVAEVTVSSVQLPSDDMKGRLIGREGRNIRAIEAATGVDLIVDDVPETVTLSCFDPIRREVARIALERLIEDGRIHPARIEESVEKARSEVDETVRKAGQQAVFDANVKGLHPELVKLMGRLRFRYSYGENVLQHSVEVGIVAGMIGAQIGANPQTCRTAGFLHDIGKALTHEVEGPHAEIGADIVSKYNMPARVVTAIREHHDREMTTIESFVVAAADAVSAARPGARHDTVENYIQRLQALEDVAKGFDGVERCYAIQAGREVRVLVRPEEVNDAQAAVLARNIAKRVEETLAYPGQIRVVVIRESRSVEIAT
ncbi:MAG: ribonuclease Y [Chloroflexi bacterium]|nr:ribonuclease Y [Chloroflexota bacterium]